MLFPRISFIRDGHAPSSSSRTVNRSYLRLCILVMLLQAAVGLVGFALHALADWHGVGPTLFDRIVYGAPIFAPMLFPDMVLLTSIGLWALYKSSPVQP